MTSRKKTQPNPALSALPEVAVNFAITWDGRISTRNLTPSDFSSPRDKRRLLEIRATGDALLVGKNTLEKENMQMGLPEEAMRTGRVERGQAPYPIRVIVTNSGALDPKLRVFQFDFSPILIFSSSQMPPETQTALRAVATLHLDPGPQVSLRSMLARLRSDYGVKRLVCEGGPTLLRSLLAENLVDELNLTFCPVIFGGAEAPTLTGPVNEFLPKALEYRLEHIEVIGQECFARYRVRR